jgi:adenosylcobinamide-GDP ribazoletransferase
MQPLLAALAFLTRLPVPAPRAGFAEAVRLYPAAGLAVGACVAGAFWLGARVDPWLGALAALGAWAWVTGALHLDGLGDVADALGAAHGDRDRLLGVMRDTHLGSFGAVAIAMQLLAKLVLLHLVADWTLLIAIPAAARIGPLAWARTLHPLRSEGLGAAIAGAVRQHDLIGWAALLLGGAMLWPALLATPLILLAFGVWAHRRLGGMTGDVHGAGIEATETALLLAAALLQR